MDFGVCNFEQELASELAGALAFPVWEIPGKKIPEYPEPMEHPFLPYPLPSWPSLGFYAGPAPRVAMTGPAQQEAQGSLIPVLSTLPLSHRSATSWGGKSPETPLGSPFPTETSPLQDLGGQGSRALGTVAHAWAEGKGSLSRTLSWETAPARQLRLNSPETPPGPNPSSF